MDTEQGLLERRRRVLSGLKLYYDTPFEPMRGEGCWLYEASGRRFLDAYNNVPHVGHCHPHVVDALCRQAAMLNTNTRYAYPQIVEYAERLTATMPPHLDAVMFTCTGSEANDLAWRLATNFSGGSAVITTQNAYHGNTTFLDSIDGSSMKSGRTPPGNWLTVPAPPDPSIEDGPGAPESPGAHAAHYAQAIATLAARGHRLAAFFVESFFCTDGVRLPPAGFMAEAIEHVRRSGALIIADEVQAGLGRSGSHMWSFERLGIEPDVVVLGKPMGNGHPIGAVVARKAVVDAFYRNDRYFNTFAGNPVSCAVGAAVLDVVERENLRANAKRVGARLKQALTALGGTHPIVGGVRGQGLMIGVEIVSDRKSRAPAGKQARWIINELCNRGVLVGLTGPDRHSRNLLKIRPPMVFDDAATDLLVATLDATLADCARELPV